MDTSRTPLDISSEPFESKSHEGQSYLLSIAISKYPTIKNKLLDNILPIEKERKDLIDVLTNQYNFQTQINTDNGLKNLLLHDDDASRDNIIADSSDKCNGLKFLEYL